MWIFAEFIKDINTNPECRFPDIWTANEENARRGLEIYRNNLLKSDGKCYPCRTAPEDEGVHVGKNELSEHIHLCHVVGSSGFTCPYPNCMETRVMSGESRQVRTERTRREDIRSHFLHEHAGVDMPLILKPTIENKMLTIVGKILCFV